MPLSPRALSGAATSRNACPSRGLQLRAKSDQRVEDDHDENRNAFSGIPYDEGDSTGDHEQQDDQGAKLVYHYRERVTLRRIQEHVLAVLTQPRSRNSASQPVCRAHAELAGDIVNLPRVPAGVRHQGRVTS